MRCFQNIRPDRRTDRIQAPKFIYGDWNLEFGIWNLEFPVRVASRKEGVDAHHVINHPCLADVQNLQVNFGGHSDSQGKP